VRNGRAALEYVIPLRWSSDAGLVEITGYLRWLAGRVDVTVVDGSEPELFARHATAWAGLCRHLPPDPLGVRNGKVAGVLTGVRLARHEKVVIADDDVRHDAVSLDALERMLEHADLVRPQNVFEPRPWHARWDTGRSLLNRALGADHPGTFGLRRSALRAAGGYDGDVLFENLELVRTVRAAGGVVRAADEVVVRRLPPDVRHFWSQRVRQAYDDFAQPGRLAAELAVAPTVALLAARRPAALLGLAAGLVVLAEIGRRRSGGAQHFAAGAAGWAPFWMTERMVCVWLAMAERLRGGVRYSGGRIRVAAHSERELRNRRRAELARP
jgi:hypothetical protein